MIIELVHKNIEYVIIAEKYMLKARKYHERILDLKFFENKSLLLTIKNTENSKWNNFNYYTQ
ncbi:MAG: hypothetical protein KBG30_06570 [Bacteroidales bacterium]|nr:hypothetical protein [Bacteroidales bacterium]